MCRLNFARFDSLVCIVARSREKFRSLLLVLFFARYRSLQCSICPKNSGGAAGWERRRRESGGAAGAERGEAD